jgi:hypothetical protein
LLGMLLSLLFAQPALAGRCPNGNVYNTGSTADAVVSACGYPDSQVSLGVQKVRGKWVAVERWTYEGEPGTLEQVLEFHDGNLVRESAGRRL